jgi:hypothetical protein
MSRRPAIAGPNRRIDVATSAVLVATTITASACGLTGPADPERSVVGTYVGQWTFGIHDPDTIARGTNDGEYQGFIACPGSLEISAQNGQDIHGQFTLSPDGITSCTSQGSGFCADSKVAAFCRNVAGTLEGEAFSAGAPSARTILYEFRIAVGGQEGRSALSLLTGCRVVGAQEDWFSGGVTEDVSASASTAVTAECDGHADLQRVDMSVRLTGTRVGR